MWRRRERRRREGGSEADELCDGPVRDNVQDQSSTLVQTHPHVLLLRLAATLCLPNCAAMILACVRRDLHHDDPYMKGGLILACQYFVRLGYEDRLMYSGS